MGEHLTRLVDVSQLMRKRREHQLSSGSSGGVFGRHLVNLSRQEYKRGGVCETEPVITYRLHSSQRMNHPQTQNTIRYDSAHLEVPQAQISDTGMHYNTTMECSG